MDLAKQIEIYQTLCVPAADAIKPITVGDLKGKSDINPQWRIEAMTQAFGLCGIGWKFEIVDTVSVPACDEQILLFMTVAVYVKDGDQWSAPVFGMGGDFVIKKTQKGLKARDEAYKGCLTDALGNACKCLGVAGNIYRGYSTTKYAMDGYREEMDNVRAAQNGGVYRGNANSANKGATNSTTGAKSSGDGAQQGWVKSYNDQTCVYLDNKWRYLAGLGYEELCHVVDNSNIYGACYEEAMRRLNSCTLK